MRVAKGNEDMATAEVMAVVTSLSSMVERFKRIREEQEQEVHDFIRNHDLWHLDAESLLNTQWNCTPMSEHEEWLSSYHDC